MSKRKAKVLTALTVILIYCVSIGILLSESLKWSELQFHNMVRYEYLEFKQNLPLSDDTDALRKAVYDFSQVHDSGVYPMQAAVFALDGTPVVRTESFISFRDEKTKKTYYLSLKECLSEEDIVRLADFCKEQGTERLSMNCIWFSRTQDGIVPRQIRLKTENPDEHSKVKWQHEYITFLLSGEPYDDYAVGNASVCFFHWSPVGKTTDVEETAEAEYRREAEYRKAHPVNASDELFPDVYMQTGDDEIIFCGDTPYVLYFRCTSEPVSVLIEYSEFVKNAVIFTVIGLILLIVSVTVAGELVEKNRRAEASRRAFIGAAAHELKTPVSIISAECECELDGTPSEEKNAALVSVCEEAGRMRDKINELLEYNRTLSDGPPEVMPENLYGVASAALEKIGSAAARKKIAVINNVPEDTFIKCNAKMTGAVLENFLSNAVKCAPENAVITLNAGKYGKYTEVTVENTGSHIDEEDMPHIWEELYRGDKVRNSADRSAGLGLSICKTLLKAQKMDHGARNTEDGVRFFFRAKTAKPFAKKEKSAANEKKARKTTGAEICAVILSIAAFLSLTGNYMMLGLAGNYSHVLSSAAVRFFPLVFLSGTFLFFFFLIFSRITGKSAGRKGYIRLGIISVGTVALLAAAFLVLFLMEY